MDSTLYKCFAKVKDVRRKQGLRHPLPSFLLMTTLGIMSGFTALQELAEFFKSNKEEFVELFDLNHGVAGYTQIRTILQDLDYSSLIVAFQDWMLPYVDLVEGDWLASDGKVLGSTVTNSQNSLQNYIAVVSLFLPKLGIVLGSKLYENKKDNEIATAQYLLLELLTKLEAKGVILGLDALHCQKKRLK